jgi:hypothetical protein
MDRRARIEATARQIQDDKQQALQEQQQIQDCSQHDLSELKRHLDEVARDLRGTVRLTVGPIEQSSYCPTVTVTLSMLSTWIEAPYRQYAISTSIYPFGERVNFGARLTAPTDLPEGRKDELSNPCLGQDELISRLEKVCAEFIVERKNLGYQPPLWYSSIGAFCAWPLAGITWLSCFVSSPVAGLFLGWLPALLVYWLASTLWLPALVALAILFNS